jgi:tetratricopeptide (TPR) repeat protein
MRTAILLALFCAFPLCAYTQETEALDGEANEAPLESVDPITPGDVSPEDRAIADALFEKAAKLYDEGELLESARALESAYGYDPSAALAFNIAKAYDDAAEAVLALEWYRTVLRHTDAEEAERKKAQRAIERLEKTKATLDELDAERARIEEEKAKTEAALAERMEGVESHDGFFLRFLGGVGYAFHTGKLSPQRAQELGTDRLSARGVALLFSSSIGWCVAESFALHFGLLGNVIPSASIGGRDDLNPAVSVGGLSLGATYYWMPLNLYLSGNLFGAAVSVVVDKSEKGTTTNDGYGLELLLGKEWWVSDNWGIGAAAQLSLAGSPSQDVDGGIVSISTGLMLSLTYN